MKFDALVVGAGSAGLFTALELARRGFRVLVADPDMGFPRTTVASAGLLEFERAGITTLSSPGTLMAYAKSWAMGSVRVSPDVDWFAGYVKCLLRGRRGLAPEWLSWAVHYSRKAYEGLASEGVVDVAEYPLHEVGVGVGRIPVVDPAELVAGLTRELARLGAALVRADARVVGGVARVGGEEVRADIVVVATGARLREMGVPVAPFYGVGLWVPVTVKAAVADLARGVAVAPMRGYTKVTGGFAMRMDRDVAERIVSAASRYLPGLRPMRVVVGARPCTPDGLPVVDVVDGAVVAGGGCRLGITLGPAIGRTALAVAQGTRSPIPNAFCR